METRRDSQTVSNLANAALRSKTLTRLTTTAGVAGVILTGIVASFSLKDEAAASVINVLALVSAAVAAFGYGAIYQRERKYESTLGDYLEMSVNEGIKRIPVPRRKLALELLFTVAEASTEKTTYRILDLSRLASTIGISPEETTELLDHLQRSGFMTVQRTPNEESVSLSHSLLASLLLERRQKLVLDLLDQASRTA